ncbi:hypothetical protein NKG94_00845 [Micromonospora sp. M12]
MKPLLRDREFRAVTVTELLSVLGDQLARVALALLVFGQTGSAGLSGLTYGLTYLPTVAGGVLPRRRPIAGLAARSWWSSTGSGRWSSSPWRFPVLRCRCCAGWWRRRRC